MGSGVIIEIAQDMSVIDSILKDAYIWDKISEDDADKNAFYPSNTQKAFWLTAKMDDMCGLIFVLVESATCITIHPYMLKKHRGKGYYMMKSFLTWYLKNTKEVANKINVKIPTYNELGKRMALKLGFKDEGLNRQSHCHNGKIYDQWMLGITRQEVLKWAI